MKSPENDSQSLSTNEVMFVAHLADIFEENKLQARSNMTQAHYETDSIEGKLVGSRPVDALSLDIVAEWVMIESIRKFGRVAYEITYSVEQFDFKRGQFLSKKMIGLNTFDALI